MPPDGYFRPNPLPNQPPPFFGRGQPNRDAFRPGPPPPVIMSALMQHQAGGQHPPTQYPGGQHPAGQHPSFGRPPPHSSGYPSRGSHPQRQAPRAMERPAHLPPRPMAPMGAPDGPHVGRGPRRGGRPGGGRSDGSGGGGLPYS